MRKVVLGYELIYGSHTGRNIRQTIVSVLHKHGVENQLYAITTNNASNNSIASAYVKSFCANHKKGRHIPCLAHVLQLSLGTLLSNLNAQPANKSEVEHWNNDMAIMVERLLGVTLVIEKVS